MKTIRVVNVSDSSDVKSLEVFPKKANIGGGDKMEVYKRVMYRGSGVERSSESGHTVFKIDGKEYVLKDK